jgi:hypothetical protein
LHTRVAVARNIVTKLLIGYVVLCVAAAGGAVLMLLAAGGFGEVGLYGKIALALFIFLVVVGGMALLVLHLASGRSHPDASGRDAGARGARLGRRDGPNERF